MKNNILKYTLYALILLFLHALEWKTGIYAFSISFFFALAYSKQNLIILLPLYLGSGIPFNLSWWGVLYLGAPLIILLVALFIHYKVGKSPTKPLILLYAFTSILPRVGVQSTDWMSACRLSGCALLILPLTYIFITTLYAIVGKKLNYELSAFERVSFCFCLVILGLGLNYINIYFFSFFWLVALFLITFSPSLTFITPLEVGVSLGLGGLPFGIENFAFLVTIGVITNIFHREQGYFGGVVAIVIQSIFMLLGIVEREYLTLIAPALGTIITLLIPNKIKKKISLRFSKESQGLVRVLINKNRAEVRDKINNLSSSLYEVSCALAGEGEKYELNQMELATQVVERTCKRCAYYQRCIKGLGGHGMEVVVQELMGSAIESGKASILDASPYLSSRCHNLNLLIINANEVLNERKKAQKEGKVTDENKKLLREQVEGLALILGDMGKEAGVPLRYDLTTEIRLKDALNEVGVGVKDILSYEGGGLSMSIREEDLLKSELRETVSQIVGAPMCISEKKVGVNGEMCTFWEREPRYKVAYGERVSAKESSGSGDREAVIRLNSHKVMLCLSDGMGHGREANKNSGCAMSLIEALYRAGFNHETVLRSVETLLKVRNKEEFNAIDIAVIDTQSGEVDLIKQGAREGYIITPEGIKEIPCGSLPLGIIEGVVPLTQTIKLTPRDFLVMFSDGIIDGLGKERLEEILSRITTLNPDEVCARVMENVEKVAEEERDDCSMICARLF